MTGRARGRKSIFITGAASGMGRETARLFSSRGWFVGAYDIDEKGLATLEQELGSDNCAQRRLDVSQLDEFNDAMRSFAEETGGRMDLLFANAGIGESGWFEDIPFEAALRVVQVNFVGEDYSRASNLQVVGDAPAGKPRCNAARQPLVYQWQQFDSGLRAHVPEVGRAIETLPEHGEPMGRRILNRKDLRADFEAAERRAR